ncbi:MAG: hypothetical protein NTZ05_15260 [Chloroflexi bacterium]|nr:hypothetical protein [Chloroflexota bacterium]
MAPVLWTLRLVVVWMTAVMLMQPAVDHHLLERVPGHEHWPPAVGADTDHHLHYADLAHHHDHGAPAGITIAPLLPPPVALA